MKPPEVCPNCGANVPPNAKACLECGSDETTGWSETAYASGLGLPEEEFDYNEFVRDEFGRAHAKPQGFSWIWWVTGLILAGLLLLLFLR